MERLPVDCRGTAAMQEANGLEVRLEPWCASMLERREHLTWSRRCSKGDGRLKAAIRYCAVIRRGSDVVPGPPTK